MQVKTKVDLGEPEKFILKGKKSTVKAYPLINIISLSYKKIAIKSQPANNQYNNLILSHGLNLQVLWELGTKLELAMPDDCMVIGIVISDCINFNEKLSDKLALSFSKIINIIKQKAKNWFALNTLPASNRGKYVLFHQYIKIHACSNLL